MSRYLRILEKANLEKDLFGGLPEADASAEFPPAQDLEEEARPEAGQRAAASLRMEPSAKAKQPAAANPVVQPSSEWRDELAQLLGLEALPERTRIGMCPLGGMRSAAEAAVCASHTIS